MYRCRIPPEDLREIEYQRDHHPDALVRKRMTILWLKHQGLPHHQIAELSDAHPNTVTATVRKYVKGGLTPIRDRNIYRPPSQLDFYRTRLSDHFSAHPPRTLKEAAADIEWLTGLSFTLAHVRGFLISTGLGKPRPDAFQNNQMLLRAPGKAALGSLL
ncbi:MAG: helix-turn-helix domain-containing protein [Chromatiaceae bacterium]|nr:MAG: helix-turn-helix domain-containing protein [Chromatiaceae bacterium]